MKSPVRLLPLSVIIVCLIILVLLLPSAASAWFFNSANAQLARAASLPADSPVRVSTLNDANAQLTQASGLAQNPRIALAFARGWLEHYKPQRAVDSLQTSGNVLHDDFMAQFVWGNAEWSAGNHAAAFEHWRQAGALKYFTEEAHRALFRDDWSQAENYARIAIGIAPQDADSHFLLADALVNQRKNDDEAMRELERAAQIVGGGDNEFLSTILSRQGELLEIQGKYSQAIEYFTRARKVAPIDARPRTDYARTILKINPAATSEARDLLTQVVTDSSWYIDAYILLANLAEKDGELAQAENWYKTGLSKNPNDARLFFPLGEFYARQKRIGDGKDTLTLALKYETRPDVLQAISRALTQLSAK
ncbi:MAG: tetratricopeptide repeat protein [Chloroflexi bacterium]|nr:tetratricopeptide repeat protein [Chloroflexota bacterium]